MEKKSILDSGPLDQVWYIILDVWEFFVLSLRP